MDGLRQTPDNAERAFWSWLGFWLQILVLGVLAIIGAFAASAADRPGEYSCGMALSLGAIALAFLRLKRRLDGHGSGWADFLLVGDMWNLTLVIPLFTVIGLAGLFMPMLGNRALCILRGSHSLSPAARSFFST